MAEKKARKGQDPELAAIKRIRDILGGLTSEQARRVVSNTYDWQTERMMTGAMPERLAGGGTGATEHRAAQSALPLTSVGR